MASVEVVVDKTSLDEATLRRDVALTVASCFQVHAAGVDVPDGSLASVQRLRSLDGRSAARINADQKGYSHSGVDILSFEPKLVKFRHYDNTYNDFTYI